MRLQRFIITPFCIRNPKALREARGGGYTSNRDPLSSEYLEGKLNLLESMPSAALQGQDNPSFTWIVIVDPLLPHAARERLIHSAGGKVNIIIHRYDEHTDWSRGDWLEPYFHCHPDFVLTTHLDDDDAISRAYVEELHSAAKSFIASSEKPLIRIFGCKAMWDWTRVPFWTAPLGIRSDRYGAHSVSSCGLSVLCKHPEISLSILALRHKRAEHYLNFAETSADASVANFRDRLTAACADANIDPVDDRKSFGFEDISGRTG